MGFTSRISNIMRVAPALWLAATGAHEEDGPIIAPENPSQLFSKVTKGGCYVWLVVAKLMLQLFSRLRNLIGYLFSFPF